MEQQLYYKEITEACVGSCEAKDPVRPRRVHLRPSLAPEGGAFTAPLPTGGSAEHRHGPRSLPNAATLQHLHLGGGERPREAGMGFRGRAGRRGGLTEGPCCPIPAPSPP